MCVDINKNVCILLQNKSIKNCQIEIRTQGLENLGKHLGKQAGNLNHSATSYDAKYQPIFDISSFHLFGDVIYCTKNKCFERVFCSFSKHFLSNYTVPWTEEHCIRSLRVKSSHLSMLTCMAYNAVDPLFISPQFRSIILSFTALEYEKLILRSKIWPDTFTNSCRCLSRESPLAKICWWLPFAAGLTSALSVAGVFMQMWPKFEIILLNLAKIRHFVTGIALKELLNAVRKRMREVTLSLSVKFPVNESIVSFQAIFLQRGSTVKIGSKRSGESVFSDQMWKCHV